MTFAPSSSELRFVVVGRSDSSDRWTPIGLAPERSPEMAERRIASFRANGSELEYAFIAVSADPKEQQEQVRRFVLRSAPAEPVCILKTIARIDAAYEPDPAGGVINAIGTTVDGRKVDLWIYNDGDGPLVSPGASFLPYGGIYYNPWPLTSIRDV